jgi:hypothetical protein
MADLTTGARRFVAFVKLFGRKWQQKSEFWLLVQGLKRGECT